MSSDPKYFHNPFLATQTLVIPVFRGMMAADSYMSRLILTNPLGNFIVMIESILQNIFLTVLDIIYNRFIADMKLRTQ